MFNKNLAIRLSFFSIIMRASSILPLLLCAASASAAPALSQWFTGFYTGYIELVMGMHVLVLNWTFLSLSLDL